MSVGSVALPDGSVALEIARVVRAACAQVDDVADFVGRASSPGWTGLAADSYRARASEIGRRAQAASITIRQAAIALDRYAGSLTAGADPDLAADELRAELQRLMLRSADGWQEAVGQVDPADAALSRCPSDDSPAGVRRWWAALSAGEREAVMVAAPGLIGGLDGLSATVRSMANRVALMRDLVAGRWRQHHGVLMDAQRRGLHNSAEAEAALADLQQRGLQTQLYLYDPDAFDGDGTVAIAAGELDDADHVGVLVPGFGNDADDIRTVAERAANVAVAAAHASPGDETAVLAWIGYDAPDNLSPWGSDRDALAVATGDAAESGGDLVDDLLGGLRAADTDEPMHLTLIGHSYGSTVVGQAAHDHQGGIDDLVVVGSPGLGSGVHQATDLGIPREHVWVGANSRDPVAQFGDIGWVNPGWLGIGLGANPASEDFAAQRFAAQTVDAGGPVAGTWGPIEAHTTYFEPNTESLWNLGHIVTGNSDEVQIAQPVTDSWRSDPIDPESSRAPVPRWGPD